MSTTHNLSYYFHKSFWIYTHLHILGVHVVCMQNDGTEIANRIKFKNNFNGFAQQTGRIVSPTNPFVT